MYRVAVCESELKQREELCALCGECLTRLETEHEIVPFPAAEELEDALAGGAQFDLLCLDTALPGKSGMKLVRDVRRWDEQVSILLISGSTDYLLEGYAVRPIQHLLKPVKREELENVLRTDLRLHHTPRTVRLKARGATVLLPVAEIRYVESRDHAVQVYLTGSERSLPLSLSEIEKLLPRGQFCRCHNSFLVNLACVAELSRREIVLSDGTAVPVGRSYCKETQDRLARFLNR